MSGRIALLSRASFGIRVSDPSFDRISVADDQDQDQSLSLIHGSTALSTCNIFLGSGSNVQPHAHSSLDAACATCAWFKQKERIHHQAAPYLGLVLVVTV
jgi:hypothetical protein